MFRTGITILIAAVAFAVLTGPAAAGGGNSANAKQCQKGGAKDVFRSDLSSFGNAGECMSYAAKGGTLTATPNPETLCGTYSMTYAAEPTGWSCAGAPFDTAVSDALRGACTASGGAFEVESVKGGTVKYWCTVAVA